MGYFIHSYGDLIKVKERLMCISAEGEGKNVIVLLSGVGSPSPVLEMKALSALLKESYTVVTLEYLGHGLSDRSNTVRTVDNIVEEVHEAIYQLESIVASIHEAICKLGYAQYYLVAHSISGVYSLYYANKYPSEVKGFIGIDAYVPKQTDNRCMIERTISNAKRSYMHRKSRIYRWITSMVARNRLWKVKSYSYSKDEIYDYGLLAALQLSSREVLYEYLYIYDNFNKARNIKFPDYIPVLYILAEETIRLYPNWYELHKELLGKNKGKIVVLKGGHYLHLTQPVRVAKEIDNFIGSI